MLIVYISTEAATIGIVISEWVEMSEVEETICFKAN